MPFDEQKDGDLMGQIENAAEAAQKFPAKSPTTSSAKGRARLAAKAGKPVPDALLLNDGKGHSSRSAEVKLALPDPSPNTEGRSSHAGSAESALPSAGDDDGFWKGADKAGKKLPSSSPRKRGAGRLKGAAKAGVTPPDSASGEVGPIGIASTAKAETPASPLIDQLAELQVRRKFYIGATNKQTNAVKALVRRFLGWRYDTEETDREKTNARAAKIVAMALAGKEQKPEDLAVFGAIAADLVVVASAIEPLQKARHQVELEMKRAAKSLPVYPWAKGVAGLGELGLAVIVAEAGDLAKYPKKGHLWKRLGLAVHGDKAYSTWRMKGGLSAEDWTAAGYSPRRRAEVYAVISEPLFRAQSVAAGPYRAIYDRRRAATAIAHEDWTKAHSHMDGLRVMTKYLLRDLWQEWRRVGTEVPEMAVLILPAATENARAA